MKSKKKVNRISINYKLRQKKKKNNLCLGNGGPQKLNSKTITDLNVTYTQSDRKGQ